MEESNESKKSESSLAVSKKVLLKFDLTPTQIMMRLNKITLRRV